MLCAQLAPGLAALVHGGALLSSPCHVHARHAAGRRANPKAAPACPCALARPHGDALDPKTAAGAVILSRQALKANPEGAPKEFKINANYLTKFGQVRI